VQLNITLQPDQHQCANYYIPAGRKEKLISNSFKMLAHSGSCFKRPQAQPTTKIPEKEVDLIKKSFRTTTQIL
jgi:hypothetical protein